MTVIPLMAVLAFMQRRGFIRIRQEVLAALFFWALVSDATSQPPQKQVDEYNAQTPKTVIELQQFRKTSSIAIRKSTGPEGTGTLINLNPRINTWYLLLLQWRESDGVEAYHLENPAPATQTLLLDPDYPAGIVIHSPKETHRCDLWSVSSGSDLAGAADSGRTYAPLCGERLLLRNKTEGHKTTLEKVTDLLRNHVWQGEKITTFVREKFYQDAFLNTSENIEAPKPSTGARPCPPGAPARPLTGARYAYHFLLAQELGIDLESDTGEKVLVGRWYSARGLPGVFVSVIKPSLVAEEIVERQKKQVNPLDEVESNALVYMVAFDLDMVDLGFEMGTEHPRVDWSARVLDQTRDKTLPGPDGIGTLEPLVMTGLLSPARRERIAATFVGGFKRYPGAFRWSGLALKNHGSHYGFIEHGTVLSKLQPGLATVAVFEDGTIDLKTWTERDNADLAKIRHARQNGVPIIEYDPGSENSRVGVMVPRWGQGNWSGSADKRFRTLRAGLGLQTYEDRRFLIYGYFSAATPSAMARVFQAYQCRYALLLDINALEHTYLAVYRHQDSELSTRHLIKGMSVLDKTKGGQVIPRFVGYPDNRDFFYLVRKANP
ncbi:MAG: hypothetical protein JSW39_30215 [Desulfobacterales bacterium]|nr:MAG: hypothetical protein JSW39_30215 [Desulfobacterales bacterium]